MAPMGVEIVGDDGFANDQIIAYYEGEGSWRSWVDHH